ncbi:MAG: 5'/3'-nucleotidase SurE [Phycisphaerales bacterium]|nr:5'/3'-nucleotidase SurE [Phycisphaerales bacterium]
MRVLLTNDDGIHAPGIIALHDALQGLALPGSASPREIMVVAPLTVQSATGHGITFRQPLVAHSVDVNPRMTGTAVDGRPADCVKLAVSALWPERFGEGSRPELVVSGMNMGANVGINVLYSGTVAAALEAAFLGVPAIAVSLHHGKSRPRYDIAAQHARAVIDRVLSSGLLKAHACININIPITEHETPLPEIVVCPMNTHGVVDSFDKRTNPLGETYYWSAGTPMEFHAVQPGSDVQTIFDRKITVTPLTYDLTDHARLNAWRSVFGGPALQSRALDDHTPPK